MKQVLVIAPGYVEANMGGIRLRRLVRHLPRHGWDPIVLTRPGAVGLTNGELPRGRGSVIEVKAPDFTRLYERLRHWRRRPAAASAAPAEPASKAIGFTSKLNRWLMVPDKQLPWYGPARARARALIRSQQFAAIFASLDPRTGVLVATRLAHESGLPSLIEYRDLWTGNPYYHVTQPTAVHRWAHGRLERTALRRARRVTAVCRGIADYLSEHYRAVLQAPVALNYNFFDPDEYPSPERETVPVTQRPFTIIYTGAMYGERSPHAFFEGLQQFVRRRDLGPEQIRFSWAGGAAGIDDLQPLMERTGVRPYLEFLGQIPHREALEKLVSSHVALLIQAPGDAIHIPGKLFEAMGARVPLLALAHPCEVTEIITRCQAGRVCAHRAESVAEALEEFYEGYRQKRRWTYSEREVEQFAASSAVRRLAALLDETSA